MSSVTQSGGGRSMGRIVAAVILTIIAILFIIAGVIYATEPAGSISPAFLGRIAGSTGHHPLRMVGVFVIAGVCLIAALFALFYRPKGGTPAQTRESTPAGQR